MFKFFFPLFLSLIASAYLSAQSSTDSFSCGGKLRSNVEAYIEGYRGAKEMKRSFFYNDFEIKLADSSYHLISYRLAYDIPEKIYVFAVRGSICRRSDHKNFPEIEESLLIAIDCIIIEKNGRFYYAEPFAFSLK